MVPSGCDAPQSKPRMMHTVPLTAGREQPDVEVSVVDGIKVVLPGPKSGADLAWVIAGGNARVLKQLTPVEYSPASGDAPAMSTVSYYAKKAGRSHLLFFLVHKGQAEATPVASCMVTISVSED
jgi:hypothetical protein